MSASLWGRITKAEQAVRLVLTVREWETLTDPAKVESQFQAAAERIPLCTTGEEVMAVLDSLPTFDPDIMARCGRDLLPLIPDGLIQPCIALQDQAMRRQEIRDKVRRALRKGLCR